MADVVAQTEAVNSENQEADSAPADEQNNQATPPTGEQPAAESSEQRHIPYPRFQEVVHKKNELEARLRDVESRLQGQAVPQPNNVDPLVKRYIEKLGVSEDAAREMVDIQRQAAREERIPLEQKVHAYEIREWSRSLEGRFKDYKDMVPEMEKAFSALDPQAQSLVVSSPVGLEMLYKHVKSDVLERKLQDSFNAGANQAYQTKGSKQAMSSLPGSSTNPPSTKITRESIAAMDIETYKKRLPEINAWLAAGAK